MFIATQQKINYGSSGAECCSITHGAPLERESTWVRCYRHLAAPRPDPGDQHYYLDGSASLWNIPGVLLFVFFRPLFSGNE